MSWIMQHKLIFIIVIVLVVGGVWYGLSQGSSAPPLLTTDTAGAAVDSSASPTADGQLVSTLLTLRAVTLSGTIFSEPAFASLQDFGTTIVPEPIGRPNPFAPLSSGQPVASTTQHAAQIFAPKK